MSSLGEVAEPDSGLVCLAMLARFHGVAAESDQVQHQCGQSGRPFGPTAY